MMDYHQWMVIYMAAWWVYMLTDEQCTRLVYANAGKVRDIPAIPGI